VFPVSDIPRSGVNQEAVLPTSVPTSAAVNGNLPHRMAARSAGGLAGSPSLSAHSPF
jgi:hypothetical protein